jgi:hypothetical protein
MHFWIQHSEIIKTHLFRFYRIKNVFICRLVLSVLSVSPYEQKRSKSASTGALITFVQSSLRPLGSITRRNFNEFLEQRQTETPRAMADGRDLLRCICTGTLDARLFLCCVLLWQVSAKCSSVAHSQARNTAENTYLNTSRQQRRAKEYKKYWKDIVNARQKQTTNICVSFNGAWFTSSRNVPTDVSATKIPIQLVKYPIHHHKMRLL